MSGELNNVVVESGEESSTIPLPSAPTEQVALSPPSAPIRPSAPIPPIPPIPPLALRQILTPEATSSQENKEEEIQLTLEQLQLLASLPQPALNYQQIDKSMNTNYNYKESNHSMICDIIAMYLKGQKILYTESKSLCEHRLNYLMLPTIIITAICTVLSIALKDYQYGGLIVSGLNAFNFFFLNLINYLKLDAKAEAHRVSAYKFDKLQSKLEFNSGKILFIAGAHRTIEKLISDTENDVREIKETNQFILPELIRHNYPRLHSINVFSEVKKIQTEEIIIVNHLKDIMNQMIEIKVALHTDPTNRALQRKLALLESNRQDITTDYINIKNEYLSIDKIFETEMESERIRMVESRWGLCFFLKT